MKISEKQVLQLAMILKDTLAVNMSCAYNRQQRSALLNELINQCNNETKEMDAIEEILIKYEDKKDES